MLLLPVVFMVHEYEKLLCLDVGLTGTGKN